MNLLDKTEELFHKARISIVEALIALYACHEQEAWKERYGSWGEFVEVLGLSQSDASKKIKSYTHYVIEGGVSPAKLGEIDLEKAYLAISLDGTPEEQIEKAGLLSRQEIKSQKEYEKHGFEHEHEIISICKKCSLRLG